jgi:hypothetical protein
MIEYFQQFYFKSSLLSKATFDSMCLHGKIIERDERGIKVILLDDGDFLKIFRVRSLVSGTQLYTHARRFCRNAKRLESLNIPTVRVKKLFYFEDNRHAAVLYSPLVGETIREYVQQSSIDADGLAKKLGKFMANLHWNGVHFHSLHTGNIVITPQGEIGLIDISDMSIYPWPLFCNTRVRSFKRLCRYPEDIKKLGAGFWELLEYHYFKHSLSSPLCKNKILRTNKKLMA